MERVSGDFPEVGQVNANLAEDPLDGGDAQPVEDVVLVCDPVQLGPSALDDLDAPGTVRRPLAY